MLRPFVFLSGKSPLDDDLTWISRTDANLGIIKTEASQHPAEHLLTLAVRVAEHFNIGKVAGARDPTLLNEFQRLSGETSPYDGLIGKDIGRSFSGRGTFQHWESCDQYLSQLAHRTD
jgi:hypothetical protein